MPSQYDLFTLADGDEGEIRVMRQHVSDGMYSQAEHVATFIAGERELAQRFIDCENAAQQQE